MTAVTPHDGPWVPRAVLVPVVILLIAMARGAAADAIAPPPGAARTLVVCAPGYPGTTAAAQPTMDRFAQAVAAAAGWPDGSLRAIYFETEEKGVRRLAEADAALALVPLPFFLKHGEALALAPKLQVVQEAGATEVWSLAAKRGAVASAAALADWEVTGVPGYAPGFVRGALFGDWGALPGSARITFTPAVLSALRRAAAGEKVAVVLDAAQAAALPSLPFAGDLEVVTRSRPLPGSLLCAVGARLPADDARSVFEGLLRMHRRPGDADLLKSMLMTRFEPIDRSALEDARREASAVRSTRP